MSLSISNPADSGIEVVDLRGDLAFAKRKFHTRDVAMQMAGMERLARAFVESPDTILQELVNAAVDLCGADSAGISIENPDGDEASFYHWVATAGEYRPFLNAMLPRYPSACGLTLDRGGPQLFRVSQRFFDLMGVDAPIVTDGLLIPWEVDETRGTVWIMAHRRTEAFDGDDCRMMQTLANFAAMGVRQQRQQRMLLEQASATAAAAMANDLAHKINNPLQSLTNVVYLASADESGNDARTFALQAEADLEKLSVLVKKLLTLPSETLRSIE